MSRIEISSSPEPVDFSPPRRKPPLARPKSSSTRPRISVIELTDSDSDSPALKRTHVRGISQNASAGSSSQTGIGAVKRGSSSNASFLPSDEENNPFITNGQMQPQVLSPRRTHASFPLKTASSVNTLPSDANPLDAATNPDPMPNEGLSSMGSLSVLNTLSPETTGLQILDPTNDRDVASVNPQPLEPNPESAYVASVLEILPDVDPDHALSLVLKYMPDSQNATVERVLHTLFEDPSYPKVQKGKGKKRQVDGEDAEDDGRTPSKKIKIDYADKNRPHKGGPDYVELALEHLQMDFPYAPKPFLRTVLARYGPHYAPTYLYLRRAETDHQEGKGPLPYVRKNIAYTHNSKGKRKQLQDAEFDAERAWLVAEHINPTQPEVPADFDEDDENGIECGCCFSSFPFDKMVQCPEAHLFCSDCMTNYASSLLGSHNPDIKCMDQSGCKAEIPPSELRRFLPKKLLKLWERVKQRKEVQAAGLEDLEECPFCEWGCVIDNPDEKLLRCGNEDECGIVSCRQCKKKDHLPKSCKEAEEDKHLDGQHAVEEAMTQALMRNCPKCKKPFIKEYGCNKMSCPNCQCLSCYVCRKEIKGYEHFNQTPSQVSSSRNADKCPLYDNSLETRHVEEVKEAAKAAMQKFKKDNPDAEEGAIKVDIPAAPVPPAMPLQPFGMHMAAHDRGFGILLNNAAGYRAEAARIQAQADLDRANADLILAEQAVRQIDQQLNVLHQTRIRMPHMDDMYRNQIIQVGERRGRANNDVYERRRQVQQATLRLGQTEQQVLINQQQLAVPPFNNPFVAGAIPPALGRRHPPRPPQPRPPRGLRR